jgi:DNA invertase Pin-like site-specific DNA recombinase
MSILHNLLLNGIKIWTIKDNYRLDDDIQAKVIAFTFGLTAEIERNLISLRTKEALARRKSEGIKLGRPKGSKTAQQKLSEHKAEIQSLLYKKVPKSDIARRFGVCRNTLYSYLKNL